MKFRNIESEVRFEPSWRNGELAEVRAFCQLTEPEVVMASYHMNSVPLLALLYCMRLRTSVARAESPPPVSWLMNQPSKP